MCLKSTVVTVQCKTKEAEEELLPCSTESGWTELRVFIEKLAQTAELHKHRLQLKGTNAAFQLWRQQRTALKTSNHYETVT